MAKNEDMKCNLNGNVCKNYTSASHTLAVPEQLRSNSVVQ